MLNEADTLIVLTALAQETRLRIVRTLIEAYPRGVAAGRLAQSVGRAPATLTFHLHLLEQAELVQSHRVARSIIYTARPERLTGLLDGLLEGCCGDRPELCRAGLPEPAASTVGTACCRAL